MWFSRKNWIVWLFCCLLLQITFKSQADSIKVAAGWARPPYVIPETHSGFELDVVKNVLINMGHTVEFIYAPYERLIEMLKQHEADLALTLNANSSIDKHLLSDVFVVYQNVALSLAKNNIVIDGMEHLSRPSIVAFQSAAEVLGNDFTDAVTNNNRYIEMENQTTQLELFYQGEVEVIIIDLNVFFSLRKNLSANIVQSEITFHPIFPANRYSAGFNDLELKQQFNQALIEFIAKGGYSKLQQKYNIRELTPISS